MVYLGHTYLSSSVSLVGQLTSVKISDDSQYALINHAPDVSHFRSSRALFIFIASLQGTCVLIPILSSPVFLLVSLRRSIYGTSQLAVWPASTPANVKVATSSAAVSVESMETSWSAEVKVCLTFAHRHRNLKRASMNGRTDADLRLVTCCFPLLKNFVFKIASFDDHACVYVSAIVGLDLAVDAKTEMCMCGTVSGVFCSISSKVTAPAA